jgi:4-alpha-glucanotransferase
MNRPATTKGNWQWRLSPGALKPSVAKKWKSLTKTFGRTG